MRLPTTFLTEANLVRVLQERTRRKVGLLDYGIVARGAPTVLERIAELKADGVAVAIVDTVTNQDLLRLGPAPTIFSPRRSVCCRADPSIRTVPTGRDSRHCRQPAFPLSCRGTCWRPQSPAGRLRSVHRADTTRHLHSGQSHP